jgi:hypothetical protein
MERVAKENTLDLAGMTLFYYEVFEKQYDEDSTQWSIFNPEPSFPTNVEVPKLSQLAKLSQLEGYDVTTFAVGTSPECSPLSCNGLAARIAVDPPLSLRVVRTGEISLKAGKFDDSEPGPFRIFAVHTLSP